MSFQQYPPTYSPTPAPTATPDEASYSYERRRLGAVPPPDGALAWPPRVDLFISFGYVLELHDYSRQESSRDSIHNAIYSAVKSELDNATFEVFLNFLNFLDNQVIFSCIDDHFSSKINPNYKDFKKFHVEQLR